ncbi:hypothetical protein ASPCAL10257 [Aspergillus calidoustus]|uniref:Uncharacterized protein n=1 Tax=Aspergillus calidoustus TaxID=454130 RepID=A0A0U4ZB60_ASPCI|nr:hypothetical protein ASPCAL10257 [Aspergillus calidoustus]
MWNSAPQWLMRSTQHRPAELHAIEQAASPLKATMRSLGSSLIPAFPCRLQQPVSTPSMMLHHLTAVMHLAPLKPSLPSSKVAIPAESRKQQATSSYFCVQNVPMTPKYYALDQTIVCPHCYGSACLQTIPSTLLRPCRPQITKKRSFA